MKLSTRARYGVRALLDIALHGKEGPVLLRSIAQRQEVSAMYLEHLIAPLIAAGILGSTRGARGGVWLAKPSQEIKLGEVVQLLEGSIAPAECVNDATCCTRSDSCVAREVWNELKEAMDGVLDAISLQDLVERQKGKEQSAETMYHI